MQEITQSTEYLSLSGDQLSWASGTAPFPKGKDDLFRVVHEHGEFFASAQHKIFSSSREYLPLGKLSLGSLLFLPPTTSDVFLSAFRSDVLHYSQKAVDSLASYLECSHRYDLRLLLGTNVVLTSAPSPSGAQEFDPSFARLDALRALEQLHTHLCRLSAQSSTGDSSPQLARLAEVSEDLASWLASEHTSQDILRSSQFHCLIESHRTIQLSSSGHTSSLSSLQSLPQSAILSIEKWRRDWIWDLTVDGTHNYLAANAIHHNSGKSTAMCQEVKTCLLESPGSIWVVGRKLLPSLRDTTMRTMLNIIPQELVRTFNKASLTLTLKNGSEIWFRPLYDPEVLKSYEIAGFAIDEANEVDEEIYKRLKDRMRQKLRNGSRPRYQSIIALNPTDEDHWIPQLFLHQKPEGHEMFVSTTFDNAANLPPEYVKELEQMYSPDVLQRLLYGQFGKVHKGRPVYPQFSRGNHIYPLEFDPKLPLIRGWDFGYQHPAVVFMQLCESQVRILGELMGKRTYLDDFVEDMVLPYQNLHFKNASRFLDYCDPHGADKTDKPKTSIQILNEKRIFPVYRRTYIKEGIQAVKRFLDTKDRQGNSNFIIHPRCKLLIEGLKGGYHRLDGDEEPEKDGYYDHLCDAMRYSLIFIEQRQRIHRLETMEMNVFIDPRTGRRIEYGT